MNRALQHIEPIARKAAEQRRIVTAEAVDVVTGKRALSAELEESLRWRMRSDHGAAVCVSCERDGAEVVAAGETNLSPLPRELTSARFVMSAQSQPGLHEVARHIRVNLEIDASQPVRPFLHAWIWPKRAR